MICLETLIKMARTLGDVHSFIQSETQSNFFYRLLFGNDLSVRFIVLDKQLAALVVAFEVFGHTKLSISTYPDRFVYRKLSQHQYQILNLWGPMHKGVQGTIISIDISSFFCTALMFVAAQFFMALETLLRMAESITTWAEISP